MANNEKALVGNAQALAEALQEYGHDVTYLDILDDLACLGLTLVPATKSNVASDVYMKEIEKLTKAK